MKTIEWAQLRTSIFRCARAANSIVGGGVGPKFKLIQALIVLILTFKNEKDPFKIKHKSDHNIYPIVFQDSQRQPTQQSWIWSGQNSK